MNDSRHEILSKLFLAAAELRPDQRDAFLDERCGDDVELRARVTSMLAHDDDGPGRLHAGVVAGELLATDSAPPRRVGPYEILEEIGEGGMGVVYRARQDEPIRREVAVKLIRFGVESASVIARFEAERQALALMDHPNIARVIDAGTTEDGRPYFAMEFVRGQSITARCDALQSSVRNRLELFARVCDGVQHAHHKAIIHRDLKPTNVLVTTQDGREIPKIIDFGVAKATDPQLTPPAGRTQAGQLFGTPEYMSPEQAEMGGRQVDTRTDVYALGVLLYELLTGVLPFDFARRESGIDELRRIIREDDPPPPSIRLDRLDDEGDEIARRRGTARPAVVRALRGDLDRIALKALAKEPALRYGSPAELAADVARHLAGEPVLAGSPGRAYRVGRFVFRHRLASSAVAAGLVGLIVFGAAMAVLVDRNAKQRDRANAAAALANQQARTATQVSDVLMRMMQLVDENQRRGESWTAEEMLFWARNAMRVTLSDEPVLRARIMLLLGKTYGELIRRKAPS